MSTMITEVIVKKTYRVLVERPIESGGFVALAVREALDAVSGTDADCHCVETAITTVSTVHHPY